MVDSERYSSERGGDTRVTCVTLISGVSDNTRRTVPTAL
jgi:hypothetical protein